MKLRNAVQTSHGLLRRVRDKLGAREQELVDSVLADSNGSLGSPLSLQARWDALTSQSLRRSSNSAHRYLGEVSDVSFFNSVKGLLQTDSNGPAATLESYEREAVEPSDSFEERNVEWPDSRSGNAYVEIYFSTIHVAYPFICKQHFMQDFQKFWEQDAALDESSTFNSLLLTVFAIGSYYNVCTQSTQQSGAAMHSIYFRRALVTASCFETERSIENISVLLAQCFYLLATCQTDRCWMTLGLAIRIGQSIGLHVEEGQAQSHAKGGRIVQEFRRRVWHSAYVLDRLLSLQLGRPSAIRNRDCNVRLPSHIDDTEFDLAADRVPDEDTSSGPKSGDYFIAVIKFSEIVGHVMRDLYRSSTADYSDDMLSRTDRLDAELSNWRMQLPRWLRFDRGHTFERSAVLKRQRNMLAIKFHHLRALIHRPYLCLPWLQRNDNNIKALLETQSSRIVHSERICVREAQETAHMLHDVTDKKSLVEDFPWWQMISCLICASSILLVMRAFTSPSNAEEHLQREMLEEDADTCLKVFDALSTNSDSARLARDMLQNLRESKAAGNPSFVLGVGLKASAGDSGETADEILQPRNTRIAVALPNNESIADFPSINEFWNWQDWPSEIADSMTWSSQFVDTLDPAVLSTS